MRKINKILLLSVLLLNTLVYSQKVDDEKLVTKIKTDVTQFFIQQRILSKTDVKNSLDYVFINQIPDGQVIGYSKNGVYLIGVNQSHSDKHILIKEGSVYTIYDLKYVDKVLKAVIGFSAVNGIDSKTMLGYIKLIIQRYEDNYEYEYASIKPKDNK